VHGVVLIFVAIKLQEVNGRCFAPVLRSLSFVTKEMLLCFPVRELECHNSYWLLEIRAGGGGAIFSPAGIEGHNCY